ncbi:MAG: hypothetical protein WEA35_00655 [Candidatus Nanopelagicales bacterium]
MRRWVFGMSLVCALAVALSMSLLSAPVAAAPKPGAPCATAGKKIVTPTWVFTCSKKRGRLIWVRKARPTPAPTPTPSPSPAPTDDTTLAALEFPATRGQERPPPADAGPLGPWSTRILVSTSTTGASFADGVQVIDQAGVPSLLALPDGRLLAYFVSWAQDNVMAVGVLDGGAWRFYRLDIRGLASLANAVDPSAVLLPDGRVRLYWMQPVKSPGQSQIYSATSDPGTALGIRFVIDNGSRLAPGTMVYDPTVAHCGGEWLMWVSEESRGTVTAQSSDGLSFREVATPPGLSGAFPWSASCLPDGRMRLLVSRDRSAGLPLVGSSVGFVADGPGLIPASGLADAGFARTADGAWALAYMTPMG